MPPKEDPEVRPDHSSLYYILSNHAIIIYARDHAAGAST